MSNLSRLQYGNSCRDHFRLEFMKSYSQMEDRGLYDTPQMMFKDLWQMSAILSLMDTSTRIGTCQILENDPMNETN